MPEPQIMICQPVSFQGYVVPGSVPMNCSRCGRAVWVSPSSLVILYDNHEIDIQCITCVFAEISPTATFEPPTPAQIEEIEEYFDAQRNAN